AFRKPSAYTRTFPHPEQFGVAATDDLTKSTGQPNYNASLYRDVASRYQHDSIELLRHGGVRAVTRAELAAYTVWAEPGDQAPRRCGSATFAIRSLGTRTGSIASSCCVRSRRAGTIRLGSARPRECSRGVMRSVR